MYRNPANKNYLEAQTLIGMDYFNGDGAAQNYIKAYEWFQKAANEDYAPAQNMLGHMHNNGHGVHQDYHEAFEWFQKAANQNYPEGQMNLALMYKDGNGNGNGIEQNYIKALEWFEKAAELGNDAAKHNLECMLARNDSQNLDEKLPISLNQFFDSHFLDESKKYPMNTGGVYFFENMASEQISKLGKVGYEILQKTDYQIDIGYANFIIDTSMTNNFGAGLFLHLDGNKYTIHIKNIFKDWEKINAVEEAYYCESSKNLFINDYEFNMFDDASRFYAKRLVDCINAYLQQNDRQDIDQEGVSNLKLITNALDNIDNRLVEIKEKLAVLKDDAA